MRILAFLAIAMELLVPDTLAQKHPIRAPPPSPPPSLPATPAPPSLKPSQPRDDLLMVLGGRVATNDGAPLPNDVLVERVCNNRARQEV
jgi:hypothetical protein